MKIAVNDGFGGFGLSHDAAMRYAELKGFKLYPYIDEISRDVFKKFHDNREPTIYEAFIVHYTTIPQEKYEAILKEEEGKPISPKRYEKSNALYFAARDIPRTDPDLIRVIGEMRDKANSRHSTLKIVEIPDDVEWRIEEYDGAEWIAEKHRTWNH